MGERITDMIREKKEGGDTGAKPKKVQEKSISISVSPSFWGVFINMYWILILAFIAAVSIYSLAVSGMFVTNADVVLALAALTSVFLLFALLHSKLYQIFTTYELDEKCIIKRSGILHNRTLDVPLEMITDLAIRRGIADHITHTGTLLVDTAGTNDYTIYARYLKLQDAEWLNNELIELKSKLREAKKSGS